MNVGTGGLVPVHLFSKGKRRKGAESAPLLHNSKVAHLQLQLSLDSGSFFISGNSGGRLLVCHFMIETNKVF